MRESQQLRFCKCGCGEIVAPGKQFIIRHYFRFYNKTKAHSEKASRSNTARELSELTRSKISNSLSGFKHSEKTRKQMSLFHKGKILTYACKQRISEGNKGKVRTDEMKRRVSETKLSQHWKMPEEQKRRISKTLRWRYASDPSLRRKLKDRVGIPHSEESRQKISCALTGRTFSDEHRKNISLAHYRNWSGERPSFGPYCREFTEEFKDIIKYRDGLRCLGLGCTGKSSKLAIHHIDYNKKNCSFHNVVTLCWSCNARANYNRDWWRTYYNQLISKLYGSSYFG